MLLTIQTTLMTLIQQKKIYDRQQYYTTRNGSHAYGCSLTFLLEKNHTAASCQCHWERYPSYTKHFIIY
jgi:hypothetical protein